MRLLLLNQFGAASGAPTGRILAELGSALEQQGHRVQILAPDTTYGKPRRGRERMLHEGLIHARMLWTSLWMPRADAIISLTSPACLAITAGLIARLHRARHFHWAMDLYPDVGVRLGELKQGPHIDLLTVLMRRSYHQATRVITLDGDMQDYIRDNFGVDSTVLEPFPPDIAWPSPSDTHRPEKNWLYSGNFGRAHEIDVLLQIQKQLEDRGSRAQLILQGQGAQFQASRDTAARLGLQQVHWRPPVPQEQLAASLLNADVIVVTRKADMKGLLLPSKLMLAELSGRSVLWIGDTDGQTARRLAAQGHHGVFTIDQAPAIANWLSHLLDPAFPLAPKEPRSPSIARQETMDRWKALLHAKSR